MLTRSAASSTATVAIPAISQDELVTGSIIREDGPGFADSDELVTGSTIREVGPGFGWLWFTTLTQAGRVQDLTTFSPVLIQLPRERFANFNH